MKVSKTLIGYLTFIFYQKYFFDKMDLRLFYFHVKKYGTEKTPNSNTFHALLFSRITLSSIPLKI